MVADQRTLFLPLCFQCFVQLLIQRHKIFTASSPTRPGKRGLRETQQTNVEELSSSLRSIAATEGTKEEDILGCTLSAFVARYREKAMRVPSLKANERGGADILVLKMIRQQDCKRAMLHLSAGFFSVISW